ncbi:RISC-loading complex subunit TARBP2 isoform X3 [Pelobates fuscus]|uniref:RISC-loading complex subunit TARBP2 isoform X3 n=1 Tax=Pelobates fuscus TaxID=191477 RepID=UPI002FE4C51F
MSENEECGNQTSSGCPSLEQMLALSPGKTPISLLQEYGTRIGKTPVYDLLKAEGQAHQPNFTFRVSVGDINCTGQSPGSSSLRGQGPSKKSAKHKAAEEAMTLLRGEHMLGDASEENTAMFSPESPSEKNEITDVCPSPLSNRNDTIELKPPLSAQQSECNPVGALQELVVQKGWRLPEYTVTQESGPAHRKEFTMTCRVEKFLEIGSGTSKKLAKRNAAAKMLFQIHRVPTEHRDTGETEPEEDQFCMTTGGGKLDGGKGRGVTCTWDSLRNSTGEKIVHLKTNPLSTPNTSFCTFLQELAEEQNFQISYFDLGERSLSGKCQCFVELSTQPITVCHGSAPSRDESHANAAKNALEYLKLMAGQNYVKTAPACHS